MKKVLKILGITAAVAALTPYRIHKDKETGEKKVEALLWRATAAPKDGEEKMTLDVSVGFQSPFASSLAFFLSMGSLTPRRCSSPGIRAALKVW